ncbi:MAG: hypothetical protein JG718_16495 [Candidatus Thiothrix moscowensis]|nr:hypothetical protein [Candidatus Thiothrix moscowensis]
MLKTKFKASLIHLLLSATVVGLFVAFALSIWYPNPFFEISGLKAIILILLSVDLVLGPLLTFIVFKPNKPSLKFDLAVIGAVQIAALVYGMYTIHLGHPVYVAYAVDRFTLINRADVNPLDAKQAELQASGWWKPILVYAQSPTDPKEQEQLVMEVLAGKPDIDARPQYYEPFNQHSQAVLSKGIKPEKLTTNADSKTKLDALLAKHNKTAADYAYFPLVGKEKDVIWVWDKTSAQAIGTLDVNPWALNHMAAAQP